MDVELERVTELIEGIRALDAWHSENARARDRLERRTWLYGYLAVVLFNAVASLLQRQSTGNTHKGFPADEYVLVAFLACVP